VGYHVETIDGELGHVDDFLIDTKTWKIRHLVIDIHNWLPDMKVLISTAWLDRISSGDREVFVSLTRESIKASSAFTNASLV
jgi:sporulation protein YlmC with PRC-barrel domain